MTNPPSNIRPEVVALLADLNLAGHPDNWSHTDGRPLTPAERDLVLSATFAELEALLDYTKRAMDHAEEQAAAITRIGEITAPHFAGLPAGSRMADVMPLLTDAELVEIDGLMELVAPDGYVFIPNKH